MTWLDQRTAPGDLETLRTFVNTRDIARKREALAKPADVAAWLVARGLAEPSLAVTGAGHRRTHALREALRVLLVSHTIQTHPVDAVQVINDTTARAKIRPRLTEEHAVDFATNAAGLDAALGALTVIMFNAITAGTWSRLKACEACKWGFYDTSSNHRSRWCDMAVCGNRAKQHAYHQRKRAAAPPVR
jgi:predicted RNA-binding Zn ribbon-like protein